MGNKNNKIHENLQNNQFNFNYDNKMTNHLDEYIKKRNEENFYLMANLKIELNKGDNKINTYIIEKSSIEPKNWENSFDYCLEKINEENSENNNNIIKLLKIKIKLIFLLIIFNFYQFNL